MIFRWIEIMKAEISGLISAFPDMKPAKLECREMYRKRC